MNETVRTNAQNEVENPDAWPARMLADEEDAFREFADYFGGRLRTFFQRKGLTETEAKDLSVSCVTDITSRVNAFHSQGEGSFAAWVFVLARRMLADWFRKRRPTEPLDDDVLMTAPEARTELPAERMAALQEALIVLSEADQEMVRLRYLNGDCSFGEIAEKLATTPGAARVRHLRVLRRLAAALRRDARLKSFFRK